LGLTITIVTTMFNVKCSMFSQTPKVDNFILTLVSRDLLELLPVQATGNANVRWSWSSALLDQGLATFKITFVRNEHCQAEARKLLLAPVELLIEI